MRASRLKPFVAVGVSLVASAQAHAQPLFGHAESIECTVANADLVFVGKLVEFGGRGQADERGGREGTIDVEEVLKEGLFTGEPSRRLRVHLPYPESVLANWKDRITPTAGGGEGGRSRRDLGDRPGPREAGSPDGGLHAPARSGGRDPDRQGNGAPRASRSERLHAFGLAVPREAVAGTGWGEYHETGGHLVLSVPVDERLEKRALDYLAPMLPAARGGRPGPAVLQIGREYRAGKKLLDDPGWAYLRHAQENEGIEVRIYGVRREAYRTLRSWGMDAEEPMIREEVRK